jgi:hypothetical protein
MFTENEATAEQSESTTPINPHAAMEAALAAIGMEFDPHHFHGANADGEVKPEGSGCPFAQFFSGFFGGEKAR